MKLALLQSKQNELYDFANMDKLWEEEQVCCLQEEMLEQNYGLMEEAVLRGADLIVTSEAINFAGEPNRYRGNYIELIQNKESVIQERVSEISRKGHCWIIAGLYRVDTEGKLRNSAHVWNPDGKIVTIYDKVHLAGTEKDNLVPGNRSCIFDTPYGRIGLCICWDMQFPECARILSMNQADLLVCPTWGWEAVYAHARAYENGVYVAGAMSVPYKKRIEGIRTPSEVIAPNGNVISIGSSEQSEVVMCDLNIRNCCSDREFRMRERKPEFYREIYV